MDALLIFGAIFLGIPASMVLVLIIISLIVRALGRKAKARVVHTIDSILENNVLQAHGRHYRSKKGR